MLTNQRPPNIHANTKRGLDLFL